MDDVREIAEEVFGPFVAAAVKGVGVAAWLIIVLAWCVTVLLISGRMPWLVRKYF